MPTYTYACQACSAEIERRQSFSDARLTVCESCGGPLRRVLHPVGIVFKGSGFHNTDYKKSTNGSKDGAAETAKSDAKPGDSKSGDAKSSDSKSGETKSGETKSGAGEKASSSGSTAGESTTAKSSAS